ncbi:uncharacterized protein LOC110024531 [Phalaenopsis equestris]|uniref:uncharacterized protein LOC110024531 n=1 Tax=Phalaenopsis equestris TaxID=78828 RepID=UPI0009E242FA|nr:uncharacterized protein LOC110024531 [Phalaenopsis equestris]
MDRVKDKMGLRFGCGTILLFLRKAPIFSSSCFSYFYHSPASRRKRSIRLEILMEKVEDLEKFVEDGDQKGFSECSSGCQSGWTLYLCHSHDDSLTTRYSPPPRKEVSVHEDEEDDLSMLSDASSGPPHATEEECFNFYYSSDNGDGCLTTFARNGICKRRKAVEDNRQKQRRQPENSTFFDDTATSSISSSCSSKNLLVHDVLELSCDFSANHFKRKAALTKHMVNYLHSSQAPVNK